MRQKDPSIHSQDDGVDATSDRRSASQCDRWSATHCDADRLRVAISDPIGAAEMLKSKYVSTAWGRVLREKFDALYRRHLARLTTLKSGSSSSALLEGAMLCVVGESSAGKSTTIEKTFDGYPEFQGHHAIENGANLLSIRAPASCTPLRLATTLLDSLGYPVRGRVEEHRQWEEVHRRLQERGVRVLHVDEMQHTSHVANVKEVLRLGASLKGLLVHPRWPVLLVVSGVPKLAEFVRAYPELDRRTTYCRIPDLTLGEADEFTRITRRICERVGLRLNVHGCLEFGERLIVAANHQFGGVVEWTIDAIEVALLRLHDAEPSAAHAVDVMDFAAAYSRRRDCDRGDNVFLVPNWPAWLARRDEERRLAAALEGKASSALRRSKQK